MKIRIFVGSVYGGALFAARQLKNLADASDLTVQLYEQPQLEDLTADDSPILICTSTTGQGELPSSLAGLWSDLRDQLPNLARVKFGVIVLGDSSYGDTFCGAGLLMQEALLEAGAQQIGDMLQIDALETSEPEAEATHWFTDWITKLT